MTKALLRLFDGFEHTSPHLRPAVRELQRMLGEWGYPAEADGLFGRDTEAAVTRFQREHGLDDDGVVGPLTWAVLRGAEPPELDTVFPTTFAIDDRPLNHQYKEAQRYRAFVTAGAERYGVPSCVIAGIGSRESQWGLALRPVGPAGTGDFIERRQPRPFRDGPLPSDGGFGRGLMQIDFDAHEFARGSDWTDPEKNIVYGCQVLKGSYDFLERKTDLEGRALLRAAVAGYNCGPGNVLKAVRAGHDVDFYTHGRDYSRDTLNRAGFFQAKGWP